MDIIISNSSNVPLYEQVKEQIKNKIVSNELKAGELLPSIRSLAKDLRISVITTKSAYDELEREGYVETIQGKGTYVANKNTELIKEEQLQKVENLIETAVSIAKISNISKKEVTEMLDILYEEEKKEMENNLEVKNLCKKYNGFELKDINLELPKGMIMGLIGENGAGKTTTIKAILNMINRDSGKIAIFGLDNIKDGKQIKEDIGVVLDDSFLSEYLNPIDINKIMKNIYKNWDEKLYFKYIEDFKLPKDKMSKEYSSGMKMKLKIAVALSHNPKLLILDEPTSGLDPVARNEILDIFQDFIQDEEKSILVSSHITSDLEHIADYITFINNGEIVLTKTRDELLENYGIVKCSADDFEEIDKNDFVKYKKNRYEYEILVEDKFEFKRKYKFEIIDKPTIEDIMLIYIKGEK